MSVVYIKHPAKVELERIKKEFAQTYGSVERRVMKTIREGKLQGNRINNVRRQLRRLERLLE